MKELYRVIPLRVEKHALMATFSKPGGQVLPCHQILLGDMRSSDPTMGARVHRTSNTRMGGAATCRPRVSGHMARALIRLPLACRGEPGRGRKGAGPGGSAERAPGPRHRTVS